MIFSSPIFLVVFFPITLACYFLFGRRNIILLIASLVFYTWGENWFTFLLIASIAINYVSGLLIDKTRNRNGSAAYMFLGVAGNLAILVFFKYSVFIIENINPLIVSLGFNSIDTPNIHLPLGVSFFSFQAISYLVDLYRGQAQVERNPLTLGLYISLFPNLTSGPIIRYTQISEALHSRKHRFADFVEGTERFIIGLSKKLILADGLAVAADNIFSLNPERLSSPIAWFGILCFTLQIYFDFSGYSDMAIGLGRMFGFKYPENFNYPYFSKSITDFWKRWHISLSTWLRDYLFLPTAYAVMRRIKGPRLWTFKAETWGYGVGIIFTMFLGGLWHGAGWNFIIWGLLHGFFILLERVWLGKRLKKLWSPIRQLYAFFIITISWVFFRTGNLSAARDFLNSMFFGGGWKTIGNDFNNVSNNYVLSILIIGLILSQPLGQIIRKLSEKAFQNRNNSVTSPHFILAKDITYGVFLCLIAYISFAIMSARTYKAFIYFRF